jgi:serine/threonine-protein kinase
MSTTYESGALDNEVVELEPTIMYEPPGVAETREGPAVGLVAGSGASLSTEIRTLHRSRLGAAAVLLGLLYAVAFGWFFTHGLESQGLVFPLMGLRLAIAGIVAVLCFSKMPLAPSQLRLLDYTLFGSMFVILVISQCLVNAEHLRAGELIQAMAYMKNGMLQLLVLMMLYGMFIPNNARSAATMILTMALTPVLVAAYLGERSDTAEMAWQLVSYEGAGFNALLALIGATLTIYSAHALNGLRTELHEARKFGQYQLRQKIGAGGMGEVYLAEHELLKRPCALKLIRPGSDANPLALARFEREVRSAARLAHPNTIEIFDYGHTDDGTFYYVMEFLPGMSLADLVQQFGPLSPGRLIYLMRQTCAGLAEAHALGLIHRDLKPANIYVTNRGGEFDVAKVLDFGLVKLTQEPGAAELTTDQTVSGTPLFMSPEQATGDPTLDARADLYALGAICYYAITGRPPFVGDNPMAVMIAHARDPVVPPSQIRPDVPADLEAVILCCLAKRASDRYADVKAMGRALAACAAARDWDGDQAERWWTEAQAETAAPTSAS